MKALIAQLSSIANNEPVYLVRKAYGPPLLRPHPEEANDVEEINFYFDQLVISTSLGHDSYHAVLKYPAPGLTIDQKNAMRRVIEEYIDNHPVDVCDDRMLTIVFPESISRRFYLHRDTLAHMEKPAWFFNLYNPNSE